MRIAVVGAGGVGGAYGAVLAKAGADVTFIARGAHLEAMKSKGLRLESQRGDIHLAPTQATDDPRTVGPVDVVLFCVKLWDVESAGEAIKPIVGKDTAVIPLQNGVDAADRLAPILGRQAMMGGVAVISATIAEPGVIRQTGTVMRMVFGELDGARSARAEAFAALCAKAGIDGVASTAIQTELWMKFILLASNAGIMALARRVAAGEYFDVVVMPPGAMAPLLGTRLVESSAKPLARVGIGVSIKQGAPVPDISTVDAFKQSLLKARAIAYTDPASGGTAGTYLANLFEKMGIAAELKPKTVLVKGGLAGEKLITGEADIAMQPSSELLAVPGTVLVGPIPLDVQTYILYSGAVSTGARDQAAADALLRSLWGPDKEAALKKKGMQLP